MPATTTPSSRQAPSTQRRLSRRLFLYVLTDFLQAVTICLGLFLTLLFIGVLLDDLKDFTKRDAGILQMLEYFMLLQPTHILHALPMGLLLASMFSIGNSCRHNEITAAWASGLSLLQSSVPIILVAIFATIAHFCLAELIAPRTFAAAKAIHEEVTEPGKDGSDRTTGYLVVHNRSERRDWCFETFEPEGACEKVTVTQFRPDKTINWELRAATAAYNNGHWTFRNAVLSRFDDEGYLLEDEPQVADTLAMEALRENPDSFALMVTLSPQEELNIFKLHNLLYGKKQKLSPATATVFKTYFFHHLFAPLSCLIAVILGVPLAITHERGTAMRNFILAVAVMILYHVSVQCFVVLGKTAVLPPLIAGGGPTVLFIGWATYEMKKRL